MRAGLCLNLFLSLTLPAIAQDAPPISTPVPAAAPTVRLAPAEIKEVIAEGRAAIGIGGIPAAKAAAKALALRNAVEKATGVFVSGRTRTHNYQLIRDEVIVRADGYATLKEVMREAVGPGEVRVTVRALVSLRPLAKQLKALKLTRAWRVRIENGSDGVNAAPPVEEAMTTLERTLTDAGFVVSDSGDADLLVKVAPRFTTVKKTELETAAGPMTMHSVRSDIAVRASRIGTGEVVAALSASDTFAHIEEAAARAECAADAMRVLAPRLADALMVLPAQDSQPVTLVVSNLSGIRQVGKLEDALNLLSGVRGVTRRSYQSGKAVWELDVSADAVSLLSRELEESATLRPFRLSVASEDRARIVAASAVAGGKQKR